MYKNKNPRAFCIFLINPLTIYAQSASISPLAFRRIKDRKARPNFLEEENIMKKPIALLLALAMTVSLAACGSTPEESGTSSDSNATSQESGSENQESDASTPDSDSGDADNQDGFTTAVEDGFGNGVKFHVVNLQFQSQFAGDGSCDPPDSDSGDADNQDGFTTAVEGKLTMATNAAFPPYEMSSVV